MPNTHGSKFIVHIITGLFFMTLGIFLIVYASVGGHHQKDWLFWAVIASVNLNMGILFIVSATVHKVKAEFLKKRGSGSRRNNAMSND